MRKISLLTKITSVLLVFTFSFCNTGFPVTNDNIGMAALSSTGILPVEDIGIAIDSGTVKSRFEGRSGKVIVHIQDAHCNYEAQSNVNKILEQITRECGISLISVEGAEGLVDTAWFRAFPDVEIRKEVATYFMKKGEITGAEFFSIVSEYNGTIFGAETREYYVRNLKAFLDVYPSKEEVENFFKDTRTILKRLKTIIYPPALKDLDSKISAFNAKDMELGDFAEYLLVTAGKNKLDLRKYPNFDQLLKTLEYEEKIDFDIVDEERSDYIDVLADELSKEEMTELVGKSIKFKKGYIKALEFYSYLRQLARDTDISIIREYPNLFYYYIYTKLYDTIDNELLFKEIDEIEELLKEKMFENDEQRKLDKYSYMIDLYVDLVNIELTNEDFDVFKQYSSKVSPEMIIDFIARQCDRYNLNYKIYLPEIILSSLPKMEEFYEIAMKRDRALIDNTLKQMEIEGKDRSVLIAGGFHTRGIKDMLEKKGVSYIVVTPKITKDTETPYIKVLTNQRTSLEDMITEAAAMPGARIRTAKEDPSREAGELLSPLNQVFFTIPMFLGNPAELKKLSDSIGTVAGGRTVWEDAEEEYTQIVTALVQRWIEVKRERVSAEEWDSIVADQGWVLLGSFLRQLERNIGEIQEAAAELGFETPQVLDEVVVARITGTIEQKFVEVFGRVVGASGADESNAEDSRGYEGLPNDYYTDGILTALEKGEFVSVKATKGALLRTQMFAEEGYEYEQNRKLSREQLELLGRAVTETDAASLIEGATIILIPGQRAHYGVGRNQIYLDLDLVSEENLERLKRQLYHEVKERNDILKGLDQELLDELTATAKDPSSRSRRLKDEIERLAKQSHMILIADEEMILSPARRDLVPVKETLSVPVEAGEPVGGSQDERSFVHRVVYTETKDTLLHRTTDQIEVLETAKFPAIVGDRSFILSVESGRLEMSGPEGVIEEVKGVKGDKVLVNKDSITLVKPDGKDVVIGLPEGTLPADLTVRRGGPKPLILNMDYDKTEGEKAVYTVYEAVARHYETIVKNKYSFIAPGQMYVSGSGVGSKEWEQRNINKYLGKNVLKIAAYSTEGGLRLDQEDVRRAIEVARLQGRIPVLAATGSDLRAIATNSDFLNFLKANEVRIMQPLPELKALGDKGWFFTREVEGTALIQAILSVKAIKERQSIAQDMKRVVVQHTGRLVEDRELYYLVPFGNDAVPIEFKPESSMQWMLYLINNLLLKMPIKVFDPNEQLHQRRKVMWSV